MATGNTTKPKAPTASWTAAYNAAVARGNTGGNAVVEANQATANNTKTASAGALWTPPKTTTTPVKVTPAPTPVSIPSGEVPTGVIDINQQLADMQNQMAQQMQQMQQQMQNAMNSQMSQYQAMLDSQKQANQRNISAQLQSMFDGYGLGSLAPQIVSMIQQGMGGDEVTLALQGTSEYKNRFSANDLRTKRGLAVLSPAEYIATERSYRSVLSSAGLPDGFYDTTSDFTQFIANDISPTELQARVQAATDAINKSPASTLKYFQQWYSTGDLIAYALDPTKAAPLVEKRIKAAEAAAMAQNMGVSMDQLTAESIGAQQLSIDQIRSGLSSVGQDAPNAEKLSQIYGSSGNWVNKDDIVREIFFDDANSVVKRNRLSQQERAAFSGMGAVNSQSFSKESKL